MSDNYLWVEAYSPKTVQDCILPEKIKTTFLEYVSDGQFPNLILAGPAGSGKTSLARALCADVDADILFVNASLDRGIGDVRNTVAGFASTTSLTGQQKVVFLDEADNLTQDSQKALRALIEEFQNHCRFILTCNYPYNIIEAVHSRCTVFDFQVTSQKELKKQTGEFGLRVVKILKDNDIKFDPKVLLSFMESYAPDWRGILNNLQGKTKSGELPSDILSETPDALVEYLSKKKWTEARDWIQGKTHIHPKYLEAGIYKALQPVLQDESKPMAVLIAAEYSDKLLSGANPTITLLAMCTRIMMECSFK